MKTKENLMLHARRQFWMNGFSNVSVRQIAGAAGVDVALISRYFGGKLGLFEATLENAFDIFDNLPSSGQELVDEFVRIFAEAPRTNPEPSSIQMLLTNSHDEQVGELVRDLYDKSLHQPLRALLGEERAALFAAAAIGFSVMEKSLRVDGIAHPASQKYEKQLRHLLLAALDFRPSG